MPRKKKPAEIDHKARKHAQWSASATARNMLCPGNIALAQETVAPPTGYAADWGTACHQVAESILRKDPWSIGDEIPTDRHIIHVDQEMMDTAWFYVDYIRSRVAEGFDLVDVEQHFAMELDDLGMEAGGTADAVLYNQHKREIEVVDLKTGKGVVVEAAGNAQARFYALGVLLDMKEPATTIRTTIVQPRIDHRDGSVRSDVFQTPELLDWVIDLVSAIQLAAMALRGYNAARGNSVKMDAWAEGYLNPGESQCRFCPASSGCPALRDRALAIAGYYIDDTGTHFKSNQFAQNTVEQVEADLDMLEALETWVRERRALAHEMVVQGYKFDHWHLVEKIGHRKFNGTEKEIVKAIHERIEMVIDDDLYDRKLKSPAGLERSLGKQMVAEYLDDLIVRPVTGTDLIRSSHTNRSAVPTLTDLFFGKETQHGTGK
jgi:hypothetical protein